MNDSHKLQLEAGGARARAERSSERATNDGPSTNGLGDGAEAVPATPATVREPPLVATLRDDGEPADIAPHLLDADGIKILDRLRRFGHEAYFVGGCVRDLLLERAPKDFDIGTAAHPGEVRALFRNCRLIGRRFRLAHIFFHGGKILEVATFRANPTELEEGEELPEDLLITQDNVFGTAEEDARRRDFTINGLFYDIARGRVIDYVGGKRDLAARLIRTIGDPEIRFREDPVRLLRAVRFAARLDFDIEPCTYAAMEGAVDDLARCASARLLDEVFKILRSGAASTAVTLLDALGALRILMPPLAEHLKKSGPQGLARLKARLAALDEEVRRTGCDDSLLVCTLLLPLASEGEGSSAQERMRPFEEALEQMVRSARLTRRIAERCRQVAWLEGVILGRWGKRRTAMQLRRNPVFDEALLLARFDVEGAGESFDSIESWLTGRPAAAQARPSSAQQPGAGHRKRRKKRGHGGHEASEGGTASAGGPSSPGEGGEAPPSGSTQE